MRDWPELGVGVGLQTEHYEVVTTQRPAVDWFEVISENFMGTGGRPVHILETVRRQYPVALHGVSLSIGSTDSLNQQYLREWKALIERIDPAIVSDHLCWTGVNQTNMHDLLPLPYTEEALTHVVERVQQVQDYLGRRILLENPSTYITFKHSTIPEWEFLVTVARQSGCGILLDVNNIYVNAYNHGFDPYLFLEAIPAELVGQIHIAGHTNKGKYLFDTHIGPVIEPVWLLYRRAIERCGPVATLLEWDAEVPPFSGLLDECAQAKRICNEVWAHVG